MSHEVHGLGNFYATPAGLVTARLLRDRLRALWPSLPGQAVLGLGYATPFLRVWRAEGGGCVATVPPHLPRWRWPRKTASATTVAEEDCLPFPDLMFDRILLIHGLEIAENARRLLREAWRVLKDDGRLLIVVPNRSGMWAYWDSTPFGHGLPYSSGQLNRLLADALFRVERRDACLWMPPSPLRILLRSGPLIERAGRKLVPGFAGVTLAEAVKDVYAAMPVEAVARRRLVLAEAA